MIMDYIYNMHRWHDDIYGFWMDGQVFSGYPLWPYGRSFFPAPGGFFSTEQGAGGVEVHMESFPSQALRWRVGVSHQLSKLHSAQAQLWDGIGYPVFLSKPLGIGHEVFLWNFHRFWADISWLNHCSIGSCFFRFAISENFSLCTQVDVSFFLWHVYCTYLYVYVVRPFFSSTNFRKQIRGLQIRTDTCGINRQMMTNEQISKWNWHQFDPSITEAALLGGQKWCLTVSDRTHWGSCEVGHWMAKFSAAWDHRGTCVENGAKRRNGDGSKGQALWNSHVSKCFFLLYFPYFPYDGEPRVLIGLWPIPKSSQIVVRRLSKSQCLSDRPTVTCRAPRSSVENWQRQLVDEG